ncbi:hypothetical protein BT69DRAFT_1352110 [Atractiella rhizophila]|nr:hypothetical protein BT69DRAFT_1352110 [Atractiella rhizophila]
MVKPTLEFFPTSSLPLTPLDPSDPTGAHQRLLSDDPTTGDKSLILVHPPSSRWGGEVGEGTVHEYWEECLILRGRLYDLTLKQWFGKGDYCCRPPGMKHGPWVADEEEGCEEFVVVRYEAKKVVK